MSAQDFGRRQFLRLAGGAAVGFVVVRLTGCESNSVDPITTGAEVPFLTPTASFYYKNGAEGSIARWTLPVIAADAWRLTVNGLVTQARTFTYQDILDEEALNAVALLKTMRCVIDSNEVQGLVGTAVWTGVRLRTFLDRAGVDRTRALRLRLYGADGFTNNIKLGTVYDAQPAGLMEPLLVTHINGVALPQQNGFPVRLIVHDAFGYKNVKWLTRIEATAADDAFGTYQDQGFVDDGQMRVTSRMTNPIANITVAAGTLRCVGFALSGAAGISNVEISVDGGAFASAAITTLSDVLSGDAKIAASLQGQDLATYPYPFRGVWVQWQFTFDASPGVHTLRIRATDAAGNVQPEKDTDISDGINAIGSVQITAV